MKIAAILDAHSPIARGLLEVAPAEFDIEFVSPSAPDDQKIGVCHDAVALIVAGSGRGVSPALLRNCPNAKLVQVLSAGHNRLDMKAVNEIGIPVAGNGGANAIPVAEHTLALILMVYRQLPDRWSNAKRGRWNQGLADSPIHEITGKTVGIVGFGRIGRVVAGILRGFDCRLLFVSSAPIPPQVASQLGGTGASLDKLLRESDIVTLHVPLLSSTFRLIGERELSLMKPDAILVNTGRGAVVDEAALCRALKDGRLGGAGLDVLEHEPGTADNPLLNMPNAVVTPHNAGNSEEAAARAVDFALANIRRVLRGEPAESLVREDE